MDSERLRLRREVEDVRSLGNNSLTEHQEKLNDIVSGTNLTDHEVHSFQITMKSHDCGYNFPLLGEYYFSQI